MRGLMITAAVLLAGPVNALSCMQPSAENTYMAAASSEKLYAVVLGEFSGMTAMPPPSDPMQPTGHTTSATFTGKSLAPNGFRSNFTTQLTVNVTCVASWCGQLPTDDTYIAALEKTPEGYVLTENACPQWSLRNPSDTTIKAIENCHKNGGC